MRVDEARLANVRAAADDVDHLKIKDEEEERRVDEQR